jgi:hypothetical protein
VGSYDQYVIDEPIVTKDYLYHGEPKDDAFRIFMSSQLVPEADAFCDIFWRTRLPDPNPTCEIHAHPSPQLLMFAGEEGSFEVVVPLNGEEYIITKTTAIWIPAGVEHNVFYRRIDKPMMETGILMQGEYA